LIDAAIRAAFFSACKTGDIMRHDKDDILRRVQLEVIVETSGVELKRKGAELVALCPFHTENSPSFTVTPDEQKFYCFGCGAGGNAVEYVMRHQGMEFPAALEYLAGMAGVAPVEKPTTKRRAVATVAPAGTPAPTELRINRDDKWISTPVVAAWPYHDTAGALWGYACRVEPEPGKKDVIPVIWVGEKWKQGALPEPRLLYGSELLKTPGPVLVVEGEKAADAARRLLPGRLVVTWPGGCKAVTKAAWALLAGRKLVLWPDADKPGIEAMLAVAQIHSGECRLVQADSAWPSGWDLADAEADGWTGEQVSAWIKTRGAAPAEPESDTEPPPPTPIEHVGDPEPFRILGWDRGDAYYLPRDSRQVVAMSAASHTKLNLLAIAPLWWWSHNFEPAKRSAQDNVDWTLAADSMMRRAKKVGIFDRDLIRGLGAWWDDGRCAVHLGESVQLDGRSYSVDEVPSKYTYELAKPTRIGTSAPLSSAESHKFVTICESLRWEVPVYGKLCAGWIFLAPICGALDWRPHMWITGEPGSGKTTIVNMIKRALGRNLILFLGDTTEAGVRQTLASNAMPVLFDEFESERKKSAQRVEDVMSLITQASSETEGILAKGGMGGKATAFRIRSMFCFSSVAVAIKQAAARSRITILSVRTAEEATAENIAQYNGLMHSIETTLRPDYIDGLQARAVSLIPVIRANAVVFAEAAALVLKTRRFGDQIGTLLAGAYGLHSANLITPEKARQWLEAQDWTEQTQDQDISDKSECLGYILARRVSVMDERSHRVERTVGELLRIVVAGLSTGDIYPKDAADELARCGLRVDSAHLQVACSHPWIERILVDTAWESSYSRTLLRLEGAKRGAAVVRFAGVAKRCIDVPLNHVIE
jgi:putative DNA primase/helicase